MGRKLYGAAKHTYHVYTEKGGLKNYEQDLEARGIMKFVLFAACVNFIRKGLSKIENLETKADKISRGKKDDK